MFWELLRLILKNSNNLESLTSRGLTLTPQFFSHCLGPRRQGCALSAMPPHQHSQQRIPRDTPVEQAPTLPRGAKPIPPSAPSSQPPGATPPAHSKATTPPSTPRNRPTDSSHDHPDAPNARRTVRPPRPGGWRHACGTDCAVGPGSTTHPGRPHTRGGRSLPSAGPAAGVTRAGLAAAPSAREAPHTSTPSHARG